MNLFKKYAMCLFISFVSLLLYAICCVNFDENVFLTVWKFSHFFTFVVNFLFMLLLTKFLTIKGKVALRLTQTVMLVLIYVLGFYISTLNKDVMLTIGCVLYAILCILLLVISLSRMLFINLPSNSQENTSKENTPNLKNTSAFVLMFFLKALKNAETNFRKKVGIAIFSCVATYISVIAYCVFVNLVAQSFTQIHKYIAVGIVVLAFVFNILQILQVSTNKKLELVISSALLIASLGTYIAVQWIYLPVSFNFLLTALCFVLLLPIHIKFYLLIVTFNKMCRLPPKDSIYRKDIF